MHYIPIRGDAKLLSIIDKDIKKQIDMQNQGIRLLIIDISKLNSIKATDNFINKYFESHIKHLLIELFKNLPA